MTQQVNGPEITMQAGEDLIAFRRVQISGETVVYADAADYGIGTVQAAVDYSGFNGAASRMTRKSLRFRSCQPSIAGSTNKPDQFQARTAVSYFLWPPPLFLRA